MHNPDAAISSPSLVLRYYSSGVIPAGSSFAAMNVNEWEGMEAEQVFSFIS